MRRLEGYGAVEPFLALMPTATLEPLVAVGDVVCLTARQLILKDMMICRGRRITVPIIRLWVLLLRWSMMFLLEGVSG